jgi:hypothetical protein
MGIGMRFSRWSGFDHWAVHSAQLASRASWKVDGKGLSLIRARSLLRFGVPNAMARR